MGNTDRSEGRIKCIGAFREGNGVYYRFIERHSKGSHTRTVIEKELLTKEQTILAVKYVLKHGYDETCYYSDNCPEGMRCVNGECIPE